MNQLQRCPYCGKELYKNAKGDLYCVNCGIVEYAESNSDDKESYRGYVG